MTTSTLTLKAPARDGLLRSAPFQLTRAEGDDTEDDGRTLEGYAAVFDSPTRIESWEGTFDEAISRGAFKKTFREQTPVLQFDHGRHPLIGSIPLGVLKRAEEDDHGAYVNARLTDNWLIQPVRDAIADGAVNGMSFRFTVVRDEWRHPDGRVLKDPEEILRLLWSPPEEGVLQRTLKEIKVSELGPVVFPAYRDTEVSVRSLEVLKALDDPAVRRDVARAAILAPLAAEPAVQRKAAPPSGHPASRDDAPPTSGHPSESPTTPTRAADLAARMRARLTEIRERSPR